MTRTPTTRTHRVVRRLACLAPAALALLPAAPAHAQTPAISITSTYGGGNGVYTLGTEFTTNAPILVTALGYYNETLTGLTESHDLGIFDTATGTLLAGSAITLPSGSSTTLINDFRYVNLPAALLLPAGGTFIVAGTTAGGDVYRNVANGDLTSAPGITVLADGGFYAGGSTLTYPTNSFGNTQAYAGANFLIGRAAPAAVPESGSLALLGLGLLPAGLTAYRRRKTR